MEHNSVAIVSGGMDSVTLVYHLVNRGFHPHVLSFNYGQRHKKELKYAGMVAKTFGLRHDIVDLSGLTHLISNSALTSPASTPGNPGHLYDGKGNRIGEFKDIEVPEGHYAEDTMKATVVPNRNMIMLSIAAGVAVNYGYAHVAIGVHGGDHFIYPDCRPAFIQTAAMAILKANEGFHNFDTPEPQDTNPTAPAWGVIYAPFLNKTKADIAYEALEMGVPIEDTWSCYKGDEVHCGKCGTCVERLEAINEAQDRMVKRYPGTDTAWADLTQYADRDYWKTVTK